MFGGVPKRATHTVISLLLLTAVSVLLLTGCSGGSQPVPDFNATVASEVTKETEPAAQATAEPTAKPTPVVTVKSEPQPTPKAISTVTNPETISIKHPYLYIAETGGIGVRPRKDCKDESVRAFPEKIPEGTAVREEAIGKDECSGWRRVIAVSVKRDSFWVRERYLSSTYTVSVATTVATETTTSTPSSVDTE